MNRKFKIKIAVDMLMTISLLFLMSFELIGDAAHEWLGMAMFFLFVVHHVLNRKWTGNLRKGKYTQRSVLPSAESLSKKDAHNCGSSSSYL